MVIAIRRFKAGCWSCDGEGAPKPAFFQSVGHLVLKMISDGPSYEYSELKSLSGQDVPLIDISGGCRRPVEGTITFTGESGKILKSWRVEQMGSTTALDDGELFEPGRYFVRDCRSGVMDLTDVEHALRDADLFIDKENIDLYDEDIVPVADSKYTFRNLNCGFDILRHGQPWIEKSETLDTPGSNAYYSLLHECQQLRDANKALKEKINKMMDSCYEC
jgi:hypothetical protein